MIFFHCYIKSYHKFNDLIEHSSQLHVRNLEGSVRLCVECHMAAIQASSQVALMSGWTLKAHETLWTGSAKETAGIAQNSVSP